VTTTDGRFCGRLWRPAVWCLGSMVVAALLGGCLLISAPAKVEPGWTQLFDGQTLRGWKAAEHPGSFTVRDGAIVAHGERAHLFYVGTAATAPTFQDFELKAEIRTEPHANSGIFFHTVYQESGWPGQGIEVQVNNSYPADPKRTGSLYNLVDVERTLVPDGVWWEMHITVQGKRVTVKLDGRQVVDYTEPADRTGEPRLGCGTFALQAHDPESETYYRNLRVRPLTATATTPTAATSAATAAATPGLTDPLAELAAFDYGGPRQALSAAEDLLAQARPEEYAGLEARLLGILAAPGATPAARQVACRLLLWVCSDACIPTLAARLADPDLSHPARSILEQLGSPAARQALRQSLDTLTGPQQLGVLRSLGNLRDVESVPRLIDLAGTPEAALADAALRALGEIGGPQAVAALQEARAAAPAERRRPVTNALLQALERTDQAADREAVLAAYQALYAAGEPRLVRVAALEGLVRLEGEQATPLILQALEDPVPELQGVAAQYVRTLHGDGLTAAFAARLPQADPAVQVALLAALAERGDAAAKPQVLEALRHPERQVREAAAAALEKLGGAAEIEALGLAIAKIRGPEREALCGALSRLPGDDVGTALLQALGHADPGVRSAAVRALTLRREPGAGLRVLAACSDPDAGVRREAYAALPELLSTEDVPRVLDLLVRAATDADREGLRDALIGIGSRATTPDRGATVLAGALVTATTPSVRSALLRALGKLGGDTAFWAVQRALTDSDPAVADAALRGLCDWPDQAALDLLLKLAKDAPAETQRILALRAAVRLLGSNGPLPRAEVLDRYGAALALATRTDERKAVLAGLGGIADLRAAEMIRPELDKEAVRVEAAMALLGVARRTLGSDLERVVGYVNDAKAVADEGVRKEAEAVLTLAGEVSRFLRQWQVAGPYSGVAREALFATVFPPEEGKDKPEDWRPLASGLQPDKPWLLDLKQAIGGDDRVAYLRTFILAPASMPAQLELGSDDGIKAWVNGRAVHANPAWRGVKAGEDQVPITLLPGWNSLLLKVVQGAGDWGACARLVGRDGQPLQGVRVKAELSDEESRQRVTAPPAELVLHWPLDTVADGLTPDAAAGAGAGVVSGDPVLQAGLVGNCLVFDGVDDEVWLKAARALPTAAADAWSINAYLWFDRLPAEHTTIAGFGDVVTAEPVGCQRYLVELRNGVHFWGSSVDVNAGQPYAVGCWQMITLTYDGREIALYKDGKRVAASPEKLAQAAAVVALGPPDHWKKGTRLAGKLDEFTIWRGALSQEDIDKLAAALKTKPE
jgi:HEAT repeat protein